MSYQMIIQATTQTHVVGRTACYKAWTQKSLAGEMCQ
jgi:hypothetical protein